MTAARELGISYKEIDDTPIVWLERAYQNWLCKRDAALRLKAQSPF